MTFFSRSTQRSFLVAIALVMLGSSSALAQKAAGDSALLPPDGFAGAWKKNGPTKVFTSEDLYGHINGGAEAFLELGFDQLTVQKYRDGANELTAEIYRMTDPTAARGIYLARCGKETPDPALKERHTASRQQILLQRNRYYVVLYNTAGGAANAPMLVKAAQAIVPKMPADAPVAALSLLPPAGLVPGSARIIRGPVEPAGPLYAGRRRHPAARREAHGRGRRLQGRRRRDDAHRRRLPGPCRRRGGLQAPQGQPGHLPEAQQRHRYEAGVPGLREEVRCGFGERQEAGGAAPPDEAAGVGRIPAAGGTTSAAGPASSFCTCPSFAARGPQSYNPYPLRHRLSRNPAWSGAWGAGASRHERQEGLGRNRARVVRGVGR